MVKNLAGLPIEKYVKTYNAMANIYTEKKCIRNAFARLIIRCPVSLLFATYHEPILAECVRISRQKNPHRPGHYHRQGLTGKVMVGAIFSHSQFRNSLCKIPCLQPQAMVPVQITAECKSRDSKPD
jgi:hypothetical protein